MEKEQFQNLSPELKREYVKFYLELMHKSVHARMSILVTLSGLSAALLVLASFNESILLLDNSLKAIITFLVWVMPLSLFLYNRDLRGEQRAYEKNLKVARDEDFIPKESFVNRLTSWFPDIMIYSFFGIAAFVTKIIWC